MVTSENVIPASFNVCSLNKANTKEKVTGSASIGAN